MVRQLAQPCPLSSSSSGRCIDSGAGVDPAHNTRKVSSQWWAELWGSSCITETSQRHHWHHVTSLQSDNQMWESLIRKIFHWKIFGSVISWELINHWSVIVQTVRSSWYRVTVSGCEEKIFDWEWHRKYLKPRRVIRELCKKPTLLLPPILESVSVR